MTVDIQMPTPSKTLTEIRSDVCNTTLIVLLAFTIPAAIASLSRMFTQGWLPVMGLHALLVILLLGIVIGRHHVPYVVRAAFVVAFMFIIGAGGIFTFGLSTEVTVFLVGSSILGMCFFGARVGVAMIAISTLFLGVAYLAFDMKLVARPDVATFAFAPATWLTAILGVVLACMGPMLAIARFVRDLESERVRAERANEAKSQFLAMMSHELRTPLTGVLGMAELLQTSELSARQSKQVERLSRSAMVLLDLVNDILDFSKIEARQVEIEKIPFSLEEVRSAVRDILEPGAIEKKLTFTWTLGEDADKLLLGDPTRIRQILVNLVGNAIKFTEVGGGVFVKMAREVDAAGDGNLIIEVADTGIGISPAEIERLFEPFVQGDEGTTRRFGGTGLGLSITRRLAQAMGGEVSVTSKLGEGSTFRVTMLVDDAGDSVPEITHEQRERTAAGKKTGRVLVAEDVETTRYLLTNMLSNIGHTVEAVDDGAKAIDAVKANPFDVIVMDQQMPIVGGEEATRAIRALDDARATTPIIALTANVLKEDHDKFTKSGANAVLTKPVDWVALGAEIDRQLSTGRTERDDGNLEVNAPESNGEGQNAVLDNAHLAELADMVGREALAPMLDTFEKNMHQYSEDLSSALASQDSAKVRSAAHALKGLCAQFGAPQTSAMAADIEKKNSDLEYVESLLPTLTASVKGVEAALKVYRDKSS